MAIHSFVTVNRILSKVKTSEISEAEIIEWIGDALELIGTVRILEEAVAFIEVKNYQCQLPNNIHSIIQIARNKSWTPAHCECTPATVTTSIEECKAEKVIPQSGDCLSCLGDAVWLDCNGTPIVEYDTAYYRPYFDLLSEYYGWTNSKMYREQFTPVRLKTGNFFGTVPTVNSQEGREIDEYTVVERAVLRFNFKEGQVAVAHYKYPIDKETGYPLIPDSISHIKAILSYISLRKAEIDFDSGRQGAESRVNYYSQQWDWYCGQASGQDMMPQGIDEHQNLLDQRRRLLPRDNYFSFFKKASNPENRFWNK